MQIFQSLTLEVPRATNELNLGRFTAKGFQNDAMQTMRTSHKSFLWLGKNNPSPSWSCTGWPRHNILPFNNSDIDRKRYFSGYINCRKTAETTAVMSKCQNFVYYFNEKPSRESKDNWSAENWSQDDSLNNESSLIWDHCFSDESALKTVCEEVGHSNDAISQNIME